MKIGIFGSPQTPESHWLDEEGQKRKHDVVRFSIDEIAFKVKNDEFKIISQYDFSTFDIFLVRGMCRTYFVNKIPFDKSTESLLFLRYVSDILNKPIVDERLTKSTMILSKMATALNLSREKLPQPNTLQFTGKAQVLKEVDDFPYPVIIKNPAGRKGENMYKIDTKEDLIKFLEEMPEQLPFLFQEYLPTDGDIRVLVIGYDTIIGAMKRHLVPGDFRANISRGADAEEFKLTDEVIDIAKKAAMVTRTEFAGVDLIESKGKYYVIEVNRTPQFKGFHKYTGVDPSPFIFDYLEKKVENQK
ncbi:RimK family alpha-L-glutamate ligase [Candidatus Dojkabacteria bacterium]|nr:RimK family alpha-L-glutamate ligase [Candidatus Dojkabacteria bacterium]